MQTVASISAEIRPGDRATFQPPPPEPRRKFERVTLAQLDETVHPRVAEAVMAARVWMERVANGEERVALVLLATGTGKANSNVTGYGCGKTHIAKACLHSFCYVLDGKPVAAVGKFMNANTIIQNLDSDTPARAEIRGPILVVDDVGTEQKIPYVGNDEAQAAEVQRRWFKIINHCYAHDVALVLTANMTPAGLAAHVGGRAWSRLMEMAPKGQIVDMTGVPDWRYRSSGR